MNSNLVYHISRNLYSDIRSKKYQTNPTRESSVSVFSNSALKESSDTCVSVFPSKPSLDAVKYLKDNGFEKWNHSRFYVYIIDLSLVASVIKSVTITSTREQIDYCKKYFDIVVKSDNKYSDQYAVEVAEYIKRRDVFLSGFGYNTPISLDEYLTTTDHSKINDTEYYFKKNVNCPCVDKEQYASCIPHLILVTSGALEYTSVEMYDLEVFKVYRRNVNNEFVWIPGYQLLYN